MVHSGVALRCARSPGPTRRIGPPAALHVGHLILLETPVLGTGTPVDATELRSSTSGLSSLQATRSYVSDPYALRRPRPR